MGKPGGGDPPPPPTIDGAACAAEEFAGASFPAFVYTDEVYETDKRGRQIHVSNNFRLSNSDGSCSVIIYNSEATNIKADFTYRQIGDLGTVTWFQYEEDNLGRKDPRNDVIKKLQFHIADEAITTALPLSSTTIYATPHEYVFIWYTRMSRDGTTVYFVQDEFDGVVTINSVCTSGCPPLELYRATDDQFISDPDMSMDDSRVYFQKRSPGSGGEEVVASLSYIEEQADGTWSETEFLSSLTSSYTWIQHFSIAHWDPDGDCVPIEAVAFRHGRQTSEEFIDIYDLADNTKPLVENIRGKFPGFLVGADRRPRHRLEERPVRCAGCRTW